MLCDFHAHLYDEPDYAESLAETARNLGFDKLCIGAGDPRYCMVSNDEVLRHAESYPDLFVPFASVRLGADDAGQVERLCRAGFRGLRVAAPPAPYAAAEFFPVYEAARALGMPILFHTGLLPSTPLDRAADVRSEHTRPVYLDTLGRQLPGLKAVGSGLGAPWYEEAAETAGTQKSVFFDLSGRTLRRRGVAFFRALLGQADTSVLAQPEGHGVWSRIVFGTAVRMEEMAAVERDYRRLFRALALPDGVVADIMGGTATRLLDLLR